MTTKIAINGFGRIGRTLFRVLCESDRPDLKLVAINDLQDSESLAYLLKYDSTHGRFKGPLSFTDTSLNIGDGNIKVTSINNPDKLNWRETDIDIVLECTGHFTDRKDAAKHLKAGAKRVLISAPGNSVDKTIVYGVNEHLITADDLIVSNASCTTNALAPLIKIIHENFGIEAGIMNTVHSYTGDQSLVDKFHPRDRTRGRAAGISIIPTTTGAVKAIGLIFPELKDRLDGRAIRVPTSHVSAIDLSVKTKRYVDVTLLNQVMRAASRGAMRNILQLVEDRVVSTDLKHDPHSISLMTDETLAIGDSFIRVFGWYDNEWGFSNRMLDTAAIMAKFL